MSNRNNWRFRIVQALAHALFVAAAAYWLPRIYQPTERGAILIGVLTFVLTLALKGR